MNSEMTLMLVLEVPFCVWFLSIFLPRVISGHDATIYLFIYLLAPQRLFLDLCIYLEYFY